MASRRRRSEETAPAPDGEILDEVEVVRRLVRWACTPATDDAGYAAWRRSTFERLRNARGEPLCTLEEIVEALTEHGLLRSAEMDLKLDIPVKIRLRAIERLRDRGVMPS